MDNGITEGNSHPGRTISIWLIRLCWLFTAH